MESLTTIRDLIRFSASEMNKEHVFFGHGTDNAFDEAYAMVLHVLHLPFDTQEQYLAAHVTADEKNDVLEMLHERVHNRVPLPYLMGYAMFAGLEFTVTPDVLIPRSPIAELIENEFEPWVDAESVHRVLDLCTGSGCIGIACAYAFPEALIDIADISNNALDVARDNILLHGCSVQVQALESDLFSAIEDQRYDLIVSNPPYVDGQEMQVLSEEYQHEPKLALEAGEDGLDIVRRILREAGQYLTAQGVLVVEVGASAEALNDAYPTIPFLWLEFEYGGDGVFLLTAEQLAQYQDEFDKE